MRPDMSFILPDDGDANGDSLHRGEGEDDWDGRRMRRALLAPPVFLVRLEPPSVTSDLSGISPALVVLQLKVPVVAVVKSETSCMPRDPSRMVVFLGAFPKGGAGDLLLRLRRTDDACVLEESSIRLECLL